MQDGSLARTAANMTGESNDKAPTCRSKSASAVATVGPVMVSRSAKETSGLAQASAVPKRVAKVVVLMLSCQRVVK